MELASTPLVAIRRREQTAREEMYNKDGADCAVGKRGERRHNELLAMGWMKQNGTERSNQRLRVGG